MTPTPLAGDEASSLLDVLADLLPPLIILALAVAAVRGVASRSGRSRWVYLAGLVAGGVLGVAIALEAGGLWTLGLALGLGASVVVPAALGWVQDRTRATSGRKLRRPGHDEDV
jgi:hypothetical protein